MFKLLYNRCTLIYVTHKRQTCSKWCFNNYADSVTGTDYSPSNVQNATYQWYVYIASRLWCEKSQFVFMMY